MTIEQISQQMRRKSRLEMLERSVIEMEYLVESVGIESLISLVKQMKEVIRDTPK